MINKITGQMALPIDYFREPDRNFEKGGRSFYFFDFDDNVVHLPTKIVLFNKHSGEEKLVSTKDYALIHPKLGQTGSEWESYELRPEHPQRGSYRNFREQAESVLNGREQPLIEDMIEALNHPHLDWRGPSWGFFVYAVNNNRPISIITARGHHPHTIRRAVNMLVQSKELAAHPNYLSVYPLSNKEVQSSLGDPEQKENISQLKKRAIIRAVQDAFECYGENPYHRFGMSDDDPQNIAVILEAMIELKHKYPQNAFFVINTHNRKLIKEEVMQSGEIKEESLPSPQVKLL